MMHLIGTGGLSFYPHLENVVKGRSAAKCHPFANNHNNNSPSPPPPPLPLPPPSSPATTPSPYIASATPSSATSPTPLCPLCIHVPSKIHYHTHSLPFIFLFFSQCFNGGITVLNQPPSNWVELCGTTYGLHDTDCNLDAMCHCAINHSSERILPTSFCGTTCTGPC